MRDRDRKANPNPVAVKAITNTFAICIDKIEDDGEHVLVRYSEEDVNFRKLIRHDKDGRPYFRFNGNEEYLDEYIRTNI